MTFSKATTRLLFLVATIASASAQSRPQTAEQALAELKAGTARFVEGKSVRPNQTVARVREVAEGQAPFATIVGCSDSRVPNEIVFDQGVGDLFIVRTAGQVSSYASWGSMEFASFALGSKLIVVLGHTKCGAVAAACKVPDVPGHIVSLINAIKPAAAAAKRIEKEFGNHVETTVRVNVAMEVNQLRHLEPVLAKKVASGEIQIVGGVYDLATGKVEFLPEEFVKRFAN